MRSPFPGMDPYLEKHWGDVHASLIFLARSQLQRQLPGGLRARIEERIYVESDEARLRSIQPDVRVVEFGGRTGPGLAAPASSAAVAEPLVMEFPSEEVTETHIHIIETSGERVITTIEFLSPANKLPGEGRKQYQKKRQEMRDGGVNFVEIDLTRTGERELLVSQEQIPPSHSAPYQACIWRAARPSKIEVYAFPLQKPLPALGIPLRPSDKDVRLDLQSLIGQCYEEGGFDTINYAKPPVPPLGGEDAGWAAELLKAEGGAR